MEQQFVKLWDENKQQVQALFEAGHPEDYTEIVKAVVKMLNSSVANEYEDTLDPERINKIDDGDHQGILIYIIGATDYRPEDYWYVKIGYGSCSACDTLKAIRDCLFEKPTAEQVRDYMTLALHIVQGLKNMNEDVV